MVKITCVHAKMACMCKLFGKSKDILAKKMKFKNIFAKQIKVKDRNITNFFF